MQFSSSLYADAAFPVMSQAQQVNAFGPSQDIQPPDTQLAAGPQDLLELVNSSFSVWSKSGQLIGSGSDYTFFGVPSGYSFADPRVLFDSVSGRWFASGFAFDASGDDDVYLAVSTTSDPTGNWTIYVIDATTGVCTDQPTLGLDSVDVIITWNDYSGACQPGTTGSTGSEVWVIQKSAALAASSLPETSFGGTATPPRPAPAQAISASDVDWMVYDDADSTFREDQPYPALGVFAISGTPAAGDVTLTGFYPQIYSTSPPPDPVQPGGSSNDSLNDDRIISAVWQNGTMWVAATDGCLPQGDSVERDCLRLVQLSVSGVASPTVDQDFDVATAGDDLYYPAVGLDQSGNMYAAFTVSSASSYPSVAVTGELSGATTLSGGTTQPGLADYQLSAPRWGDYSAAAVDPADPNMVWVTGEYATSDGAWGTATAALSSSPQSASPQAPTVTGVNPGSGPTAGGTSVTITGANFAGTTNVTFGGVAATFTVVSPTTITATSPAHAAGPVDVVVANSAGASPASSSDTFAYTATSAPGVTGVSPSLGPPAGGTQVTVTGTSFTGATSVSFGGVAASFTVVSPTTITATSPAHAAGSVDVVVTTPAGSSTTSSADVFTYAAGYVAESPTRILDTRAGSAEQQNLPSPLVPGTVYTVQVSGLAGVPSNAKAVALNVTAIEPAGSGNLRVFPGGTAPTASSVNYITGQTVANFDVVALSGTGTVSIETFGSDANVALDVEGYFSSTANYTPQTPARILDTRSGSGFQQGISGPIQPGTVESVQVTGMGGVPSTATSVALNVTAVTPAGNGNLRVFPDTTPGSTTAPNASTINYNSPQTSANFDIVQVPSDGKVDVETFGAAVNVVIDVEGYASAGITNQTPVRILDTRSTSQIGSITGPVQPGTVESVTVAGTGGVPSNAQAVLMNVTSVEPGGNGNLRIYPDTNGSGSTAAPGVSNINYIPGITDANFVIVQIPSDGKVDFETFGSATNVLFDVVGYLPAGGG